MKTVTERFLQYAAIDTQSMADHEQIPSTEKQLALAKLLVSELKEMGARNVRVDEHCYVYAEIPASEGCESAPCLGWIAHMDTSPAVTGKNIHPRIVKNYNGGDIVLNVERNILLSPDEYPYLRECTGQDLIVTDGTTLLGADDKAGVAEIMTMAEQLLQDNSASFRHGAIKIAFTPDEEVGRGADLFDVAGFGADFAYTVDGGALGELEYENFNAAALKLTVHGKSIHPGSAKGQMVNALLLAMEFQAMLPAFQRPEFTEGYEGFIHLDSLSGTVEEAHAEYIIRDHDTQRFQEKKKCIRRICSYLNDKYGTERFEVNIAESYQNMKEQILPHFHLVETARASMKELEIEPIIVPIRGGTDGARLSYMGLPCPNLCTGGQNFHGRFEYISVQAMEKITALLLKITLAYGGRNK